MSQMQHLQQLLYQLQPNGQYHGQNAQDHWQSNGQYHGQDAQDHWQSDGQYHGQNAQDHWQPNGQYHGQYAQDHWQSNGQYYGQYAQDHWQSKGQYHGQNAQDHWQRSQMQPLLDLLQQLKHSGKSYREQQQSWQLPHQVKPSVKNPIPNGGDAINWKGELQTAVDRSLRGASQTKDVIVYTTSEVVEGQRGQYQSCVSVTGSTFVGKCVAGKKKAEHDAAMQALQSLFPGHVVKGASQPTLPTQMPSGTTATNKRKAEVRQTPKAKFTKGLTALLGRTLAEDDWFLTFPIEVDGQYQALLTIAPNGRSYASEIRNTKILAESSAFEMALNGMEEEFGAAVEAVKPDEKTRLKRSRKKSVGKLSRQTRKQRLKRNKTREQLAELREKDKVKRAARKAAALPSTAVAVE